MDHILHQFDIYIHFGIYDHNIQMDIDLHNICPNILADKNNYLRNVFWQYNVIIIIVILVLLFRFRAVWGQYIGFIRGRYVFFSEISLFRVDKMFQFSTCSG